MNYLITTFVDSSGKTFIHVTKPKKNQKFEIVNATSHDEAIRIYNEKRKNNEDFTQFR